LLHSALWCGLAARPLGKPRTGRADTGVRLSMDRGQTASESSSAASRTIESQLPR
jgi:hypothetical protein